MGNPVWLTGCFHLHLREVSRHSEIKREKCQVTIFVNYTDTLAIIQKDRASELHQAACSKLEIGHEAVLQSTEAVLQIEAQCSRLVFKVNQLNVAGNARS